MSAAWNAGGRVVAMPGAGASVEELAAAIAELKQQIKELKEAKERADKAQEELAEANGEANEAIEDLNKTLDVCRAGVRGSKYAEIGITAAATDGLGEVVEVAAAARHWHMVERAWEWFEFVHKHEEMHELREVVQGEEGPFAEIPFNMSSAQLQARWTSIFRGSLHFGSDEALGMNQVDGERWGDPGAAVVHKKFDRAIAAKKRVEAAKKADAAARAALAALLAGVHVDKK